MGKHWTDSSTFQILFGDAIVPACVPLYYRLYLLLAKLRRSLTGRLSSQGKETLKAASPDNIIHGAIAFGDRREPLWNKTVMSREADFQAAGINKKVEELKQLEGLLATKNLRTTSAAGSFKKKDFSLRGAQNKLWENAWLLAIAQPKAGAKVLDLGGASTIFSFALAARGCRVSVVDNDWGSHGLIYNARHVASVMKWDMRVLNRDLARQLPFPDSSLDLVTCVCVLEHLPSQVRRLTMAEIGRVLNPGGLACLTIDYDAGRADPRFDKGLRYGLKERLSRDVLEPSGLILAGNQVLLDDCPDDFFLGALFLKKPSP